MAEAEVEAEALGWPLFDYSAPPQVPQRVQPIDPDELSAGELGQWRAAHTTAPSLLTASSPHPAHRPNHFLKGCRWSPDGSCLLTSCDDNVMRVYDLPTDCLECEPQREDFTAAVSVQEGETVYDYCWFSGMRATEPASCCFLTSTRHRPVHLWDAVTGELRATYRAYDHLDEIIAANCMAVDPDGTKLFLGYNKAVRVFDMHRPGRDCKMHSTYNKKRNEGQSGMLSCMDFNPDRQGMLAIGSYNRSTGVYHSSTMELLCVLHGQAGGVNQVQWSPDGNYLYTGARKDPHILCWDVRYSQSTVYSIQRRAANTNQKICFDIEPCGRHLVSGGEDGFVTVFDLTDGQLVARYRASTDATNGCSIHPSLNLIATASGERNFDLWEEEEEHEGEQAERVVAEPVREGVEGTAAPQRAASVNSLRIWRFEYQLRTAVADTAMTEQ